MIIQMEKSGLANGNSTRKSELVNGSTRKSKPANGSTKKGYRSMAQLHDIKINRANFFEPAPQPKYCVYRVQNSLRNVNETAYTPQLVSIGPLHHGNRKLAVMKEHKSRYKTGFLKRISINIEVLETAVKMLEKDIRAYYEEPSNLGSPTYVQMILLDALFIFELFISNYYHDYHVNDDYILCNPWVKNGIQHDLILLENQIPYFILLGLFDLAFPTNSQTSFHTLTCHFFSIYNPQEIEISDSSGILHFTDLLRYFSCQEVKYGPPEETSRTTVKSAAKLHECGVKFTGDKKTSLAGIGLEKGKLKLPQFKVDDMTESVVRNLMALEQFHYPNQAYICSYILLMDILINTTEDVDLLVEEGVIVNYLGSNKAVAKMVNKLCRNITHSGFYFDGVCKDLKKYSNQFRYQSLAILRGVYFANVWRGTATIAAVVLLFLSITQTVFSILQVGH